MARASVGVDLESAELVVRVVCPDCHGEGTITSDDWVAFQDWRSRRPVLTPEDEDDLVERYFLEVCDYSAVPAMGQECHACHDGKQDVTVTMADVLAVVFEHVDRPVIATEELEELIGQVKWALTAHALATGGLLDADQASQHLRTVQEAAEALRAIRELGPRERL